MAETIAGLLAEARARLAAAGVDTAALDARLLLQEATGLDHAALIAAPEAVVADTAAFHDMVQRRIAREPVSRILGQREFYGRGFLVTPAVLDPRADTETLIEAALPLMAKDARLLDLGTGSGIIAITLLAERPAATGLASDFSAAALAVARANARRHGVAGRLALIEADWFSGVTGVFDLIVSNPPYIPAGGIAGLQPEVLAHDPLAALDGGPDGLGPYRHIAAGAWPHLAPGGHVLVEIGAGQADAINAIFTGNSFRCVGRYLDLGGHIRVLHFVRPVESLAK